MATNTKTATNNTNTNTNTNAHVQWALAPHVVVWVMPTNPKAGASRPRFARYTTGNTLGQCRGQGQGPSPADLTWGQQRGQVLAAAPGSALHKAWQAATAPKAPASAQAAFAKAANAAMAQAAQAARANPKQLASLPTITKAQAPGTQPA